VLLKLILALTLIPLAELYLLLIIGEHVGALPTIALVIVTGIIGGVLLRRQGAAALRRIRETLAMGKMPAGELVDALLVGVAGAFLLTPGLLTDATGFFLLSPPGRRIVRKMLRRRWERWVRDNQVDPPAG